MFHPTFKRALLFLVLKSFLAFLTLFNFQGTSRHATVFICYHKPFGLSRTFFKFFNFSISSLPLVSQQLYYFITSRCVCQQLFSLFSKFLSLLPPVRDSFAIIAPHSPFVKHFFHLFSAFSSLWYFAQYTPISPYILLSKFDNNAEATSPQTESPLFTFLYLS